MVYINCQFRKNRFTERYTVRENSSEVFTGSRALPPHKTFVCALQITTIIMQALLRMFYVHVRRKSDQFILQYTLYNRNKLLF